PILQQKIVPLFHYALRPAGFLVLGNSETIGPAAIHFALADRKHKIYQKKPNYARHRPALQLPPKHAALVAESKFFPEPQPQPPDLLQLVDKVLLRDFAPAAVVVNAELEVVLFRGRTGDYLEHAPGAPSLQLLKLAR